MAADYRRLPGVVRSLWAAVWAAELSAVLFLSCKVFPPAILILCADLSVCIPFLVFFVLAFILASVSTVSNWLSSLTAAFRDGYTVPPRRVGWKTLPAFVDAETPLLSAPNACPTSRLCRECIRLVEDSKLLAGSFHPIVRRFEWHSWSVEHWGLELEASRKACHLCNILWQSPGFQLRHYFASQSRVEYANVQRHRLWIKVWKEQCNSLHRGRCYLQIFEGKQYREDCRPLSRSLEVREENLHEQFASLRVTSSTGSSDCIALAKHWIAECTSSHEHCSAPTLPGGQYLPKRLIFVSEAPSSRSSIHLDDTASLALDPAKTPYLALSYAHSAGDVKLPSGNKNAWEVSIDEASLPLSFQHAVSLTRQLGFRYLWIDILCTIQDSGSDEQHEASEERAMAIAHAACLISACASGDADGGCFQSRTYSLHEFPCYLRISSGKSLSLRADGAVDPETFRAQVEESPIGQRRYALQDRILPRRMLHFGSRFLFFQCGTHVASEAKIEGTKYVQGSGGGRGWCSTKKRDQNKNDGASEPYQLITHKAAFDQLRRCSFVLPEIMDQLCMHRFWFRLVSKATSDKTGGDAANRLGPLAGLALAIGGKEYQHNYTHGLWKRHLLLDLLWFIQSGHTTRPPKPGSPSWSWAAVAGTVSQQLMIDEKGFAGKEHVIVYTASVISGSESAQATNEDLLVLKCPVLRATNLVDAESHYYTVEVQAARGGLLARFSPDAVDFDGCQDFVVAEIVREVVYEPGGQGKVSEVWSNGLVLRQVRGWRGSGGLGIVFKRVGRFWMRWPVYRSNSGRKLDEDWVFGNGMSIRVV